MTVRRLTRALTIRRVVLVVLLLAAVPAAAEEPCPCPPEEEEAPEPKWEVKIGASFVATTGNSDTTTVGADAEAVRRPDPWGVELFASYDRAGDSGVIESERTYGGVRARRALGERWELFGEATGERDEFAGIDVRRVLTAGTTYHALLGPRHQLDFDLGLSWTYEDLVEPEPDESFLGALVGVKYRWEISDRAAFGQRLTWFPNFERSSDWRFESTTTLEASLTERLAMRLGYEVRYESEPVAGREDTDTTTRMSLVVDL